tara:strand:+ start:194 stop:970 length:777 start_codon:yes stop_codon:yes gene_type:complete
MNQEILSIVQARVDSSRLSNKVFADISGKPLIERVLDRVRQSQYIDNIVIATSENDLDINILNWCNDNKILCCRGSENNVLERFYRCAEIHRADIIVRITADDPFKDPDIIDYAIKLLLTGKFDYVSNTITPTFPEGIDVEVFTFSALKKAFYGAKLSSEKEHVTPYIWKNKKLFSIYNFENTENLSKHRWTIDYSEDLDFVRAVYNFFKDKEGVFSMQDILSLLQQYPELNNIQKKIQRNEGYIKSINMEKKNEKNW